jgi:hypothetical protein
MAPIGVVKRRLVKGGVFYFVLQALSLILTSSPAEPDRDGGAGCF